MAEMKISEICYASYELLSKKTAKGRRQGALIKIRFSDGEEGFADCHPWPELGDLPIDRQLSLLEQRTFSTGLLQSTLKFCRIDATARSKGAQCFDKVVIPKSHCFLGNAEHLGVSDVDAVVEKGFTHIKVKVGRNLPLELEALKRAAHMPAAWRLDFNMKPTEEEYTRFVQAPVDQNLQIDFVEDPFPYDATRWAIAQEKTGVPIAADRCSPVDLPDAIKIVVLKPAVQNIEELLPHLKDKKVVVTSYLGHPLEQASAAYTAGFLKAVLQERVQVCGLLSHTDYESNKFSQLLNSASPEFIPPPGTGFGYDDLLKNQNWKRL